MPNEVGVRFRDKVALVTAGASGIGEAVVRRLAAEGARIVVADIDDERLKDLVRELGDIAVGVNCDVRSEDQVAQAVELARSAFGKLDAAFNVAGRASSGDLLDMDSDGWHYTLDVTLTGTMHSIKHEGRLMRELGRGGAIVNMASVCSVIPLRGGAAYCSAKAGVAMLGANAALELAEFDIRVNTISPGLVDTPLMRGFMDQPVVAGAYAERIPLNRAGRAEEIAAAAAFLASDDASYVSGINMLVDGGWNTSGYPDSAEFRSAQLRHFTR